MSDTNEFNEIVSTNAGMCGLWQPEAFQFVDGDFETWEEWATESSEIARSIRAGSFVPLNVGGDGVFQVVVRFGGAGHNLTDRERRYELVSSDRYLLVSDGRFAVGGIEDILSSDVTSDNQRQLDPGRYEVSVHLIDWKADLESVGDDGKPTTSALPDLVVLINAEFDPLTNYRATVMTFDRPDD